jgi:tetratricopeptide (TPR) repeat protein
MKTKNYLIISCLLLMLVSLWAPPVFAQAMASVKGTCKDVDGKPLAGIIVEWSGVETGRKYSLKTNAKGEYFSLGIQPGKYNIRLLRDGQQIYFLNNVPVTLDEQPTDIDLQKEAEKKAQGQGMTAEQAKQQAEAQQKAAKEQNTVKALNEKLNAAKASSDAGDFDAAIATLNDANQMDPTRDVIWFRLADAYRMSATKQTDPAEKSKRYESASTDYKKAIEIKQNDQKDPNLNKTLAAYYNNLAESYSKSGKVDDAVKSYQQAATLDPPNAAQYNFNEGAVLTNSGKADEAIVAFDKVIAADPNKADAYYWKGVNLIAKETADKDGKVTAPPGTAEAFQKYLELQPDGKYADGAKGMLASIGATVETGFGKKKPTKSK